MVKYATALRLGTAEPHPDDHARAARFAEDGLGMVLSDYVELGTGEHLFRANFYHCNALCCATTRTLALSWCFLCSSGRSSVFADQAVDDVGALDPAGHIDRMAGFVQRRSLFPRLVRPVFVVVPRVRGEDQPEVLFAVDQEVVEALAPQRSHIALRERVLPWASGLAS
jgi:hypothetical protein